MDLVSLGLELEGIIKWDQQFFFAINGLDSQILDQIIPIYRHKIFWIPFYVFIVAFFVKNFPKHGLWMVLFAILTVGLADTASSQWIKKNVQRVRPCNDDAISNQVQLRVRCGGGYSFTSSHAANHSALAFYIVVLLGGAKKWWGWLLFLWATSIGFSQIYAGVHYPLDVLAGIMLGSAIGYLMARLFHWRFALH